MIRITGNPVRFQGVKEAGYGYAVAGSYTFKPKAEFRQKYPGDKSEHPEVLSYWAKKQEPNLFPALTTKRDPRDRNATTVYFLTGRHGALLQTKQGALSLYRTEQFPDDHPQNWRKYAQTLASRLNENYRHREDPNIPQAVFTRASSILHHWEELGAKLYEPLTAILLENPRDPQGWTRQTVPMVAPNPADPPEQQLITRFNNWKAQFMADLQAFKGEPNYEKNHILIGHYVNEVERGLQELADLSRRYPLFAEPC